MNRKSIYFSFLLTCALSLSSIAQSISGVINNYARVTAFDTCDMRLSVSDTTGFRVGTRIMVIQMNGAITDGSNSSAFGAVVALNSVGKYEVNFVDSVTNNSVFLRFYFKNQYDEAAALQIVTFPKFTTALVTDTLTAKTWDGETGGVIAFEANQLTLNAPIDASAKGFRGGGIKSYANCESLQNYNDYYYNINTTDRSNGGPKGEGISVIIAGKECGRGAQANGGGGGNNHKAGGGGGGHQVAGGIGGEQKHVSDIRNCAGNYPGYDGKATAGLSNDRFILGGGGGAGQNREGSNNRGGNGGGIVFITTNTLTSNNKKIMANGGSGNGGATSADGGGGGGAGGTIVLLSNQNTDSARLEVNGGAGGNTISAGDYDFGPGGGGGGGRILTRATTRLAASLLGGTFGKNAIRREGQGAEKGKDAVLAVVSNLSLSNSSDSVSRVLSFTEHPKKLTICEYQTTTLTVKAKGSRLTYEWQIHRGNDFGFVPILSDTTFIGVNTPTLILNRVRTSLNPYLFRCVIRSECTSITSVVKSDSVGLTIVPAPIAAFTANISYNTVSFTNGSANGITFNWDFGNGQTSTLRSPTYTYPVQGNYRVVIKVTNSCFTTTDSVTLRINALPKASFTANTNDYCTPANVQFTNTSANNAVSYQWVFAGGTPAVSSDPNPSVIYNTGGIYDVLLIAINTNGRDTLRRTSYIRINAAPAINFEMSRAPSSTTVVFSNRTVGASTYLWNFGDGSTSTEPAPQHVYRTTGVYRVCLTATNTCGTGSRCDTLTLLSLPSATVSVNQAIGCTPHSAQFTGQNPSNVTSWLWTFQGGVPATSTDRSPQVIYTTSGVYRVTLRVSNAAGFNTTTLDSFVRVQPTPIAKFIVTSIDSTLATFENQSSNAQTYRWDFGDGTGSAEYNPPPHRYYRNRNYTVTLQALNNVCGAVITQSVPIFVVGTQDTEGSQLSLSPNPTDGNVTLHVKTPLGIGATVNVSNVDGRILKRVPLSTESVQNLDFNDLPNGVYFLQFRSEKGNFVRKIIKF